MSVVVPTVGRRSLVGLLDGLAGDPAVCEMIVVDDRRPDAEPLPAPGASIICSGGRGPAAARQLGATRSRGEVLLLLDDDVQAGPMLATGHARRHARDVGLVVIGQMPLIAPAPLTPVQELYRDDYARWSARAMALPGYALTRLWGGHFSVRRSDALAVGLENPAFHGYRHEDLELGLRMAEAGLRGVFDPTLSVEHHYERSTARFLQDAWWQGAEWTSLRALHPEAALVGPRERYTSGLPRALGCLATAMADPRAIAMSRGALTVARRASAFDGARRLHRRVLQLSRRVEQLGGARSDWARGMVLGEGGRGTERVWS